MNLFFYLKVRSNEISRSTIVRYCNNFFEQDFKSQYILVKVSVKTNKGELFNIGKAYTVDVTNDNNKISFKNIITDEYFNHFEILKKQNKLEGKINRFIFEYKPISKNDVMRKTNIK